MTRTSIGWVHMHPRHGGRVMACLLGTSARGSRGRFGLNRADRGATSVEYALMASLIAVVIIASVTLFGQNVVQLFQVPASAL